MSKIVHWGRWLTAAFFALLGTDSPWHALANLGHMFQEHPNEITYYFVSDAAIWIPTLACAWGIFKWRPWARTLAIVLSALNLATLAIAILVEPRIAREFKPAWVTLGWAICCSWILVWLFVPAVRAKYSRVNQLA